MTRIARTLFAAVLCAAGAFVPSVVAQPGQERLIQLRDKKLASEWLAKNDWITGYDAARAEAAESGKLILAYFTRSFAY